MLPSLLAKRRSSIVTKFSYSNKIEDSEELFGEGVEERRPRFKPRDKRDYSHYKEHKGKIKWYNAAKGFGFITIDDLGIDAAFQVRDFKENKNNNSFLDLYPATQVSFNLKYEKLGPRALNIILEENMKRKIEENKPTGRENTTLLAQFYTTDGEPTGSKMALPCDITVDQLHTLLNDHILKNEEELPYSFFVNEQEMLKGLVEVLDKQNINDEEVLKIEYQPQAVFRVRQITRCVSSMEGHSEAVLSVAFSPDGQVLATGSGDTTIRFWDMATSTPHFECKGHKNWVLCVAWSPDGKWLASGSVDKTVRIWDPKTGLCHCILGGHTMPITSLACEPETSLY